MHGNWKCWWVTEIDEAFFKESFKGDHKKVQPSLFLIKLTKEVLMVGEAVKQKREKVVFQRKNLYFICYR